MTRIIALTAALMIFAAAAFASPMKADGAENFYKATTNTVAFYRNGDRAAAKASAEALLTDAENYRDDWNYGNAVHAANIVLGLVALGEGDQKEAGKRLLSAGRVTGSPQLRTFGPNMMLAKRLIEAKESAVVLEYLELCEKFWDKSSNSAQLKEWAAAIKASQMPDFGANLRY